MALVQDITVDQGITHVEEYTIEVLTDPLLPFNQTTNPYIPLDLTSATINSEVRYSYDSENPVISFTSTGGNIVKTDAANGVFELRVVPADTTPVTFTGKQTSLVYDIEIVFSTTNVIKVVSGKFVLNKAITRI